jgi:class 3 adenylate cyclase
LVSGTATVLFTDLVGSTELMASLARVEAQAGAFLLNLDGAPPRT